MKVTKTLIRWDRHGESEFESQSSFHPEAWRDTWEFAEVTVSEPEQIGLHFTSKHENMFIFLDAESPAEFRELTAMLIAEVAGQLKEKAPELLPEG